MSSLLLVSPEQLAGKTTIAIGLAQRIKTQGRSVTLTRRAGDGNASADAALFASAGYSANADIVITEASAGDSSEPDAAASVIAVATEATIAADLAQYCKAIGERFAGAIVNRVPQKRFESIRNSLDGLGVKIIAMVPEDRMLAAPTLGGIAAALKAEARFLDGNSLRPIGHPLIASISADPGQGYFTRHGATAVIVRSDKPDLQLAAISAGADCLIVTGGLPILSYVLDRAQEDEIPLIRTQFDTVATVAEIEALFAAAPFAGGEAKLRRIDELLGDLVVTALL